MNSMKSLPRLAAALTITAGLAVAVAVPAQASHGGGGVSSSGSCSSGSTWKLKAKANDGQLEVEAEVDTNVIGQVWRWKLSDNGTPVAKGRATTHGVSGSFSVRRLIPDQAGMDTIGLRAKNPATGELCTGKVAA